MHFQNVCLEAVAYTIPEEVVTTEAIEQELAPVYSRLGLPEGRLELMTGIRERRFYPSNAKPGPISALTVEQLLSTTSIPKDKIGALIHGSVCRDQMEPATANLVHYKNGLPKSALVYDISNACLGLLNGIVTLAQMIELGQIEAGIIVGTEVGRPLVEGTIAALNSDMTLTRKSIKPAFASLTIGSASAAFLVCHRKLSQHGTSFLGGSFLCDTSAHELCAGGTEASPSGGAHLQMATDSEALLHAGISLAQETWGEMQKSLGWSVDQIGRAYTHQVGKAHRTLLLDGLGISHNCDAPIFDRFGNTGSAALPLSLALDAEQQGANAGDHVALLGIGSGLNCLMLGLNWQSLAVQGTVWK